MDDALADPLTSDLYEAEFRHRQHRRLGAVFTEFLFQFIVDFFLVPLIRDIDEVDDDDSSQVAKAKLTADLARRFEVGLQRVELLFLLRSVSSAVHVDDRHRFGMLDDDVPAAFQPHFSCKGRHDLLLDTEDVEDRFPLSVVLDFLHHRGRKHLHIRPDLFEELLVVDDNPLNIFAEQVADNARRRRHILVKQGRGGFFLDGFFNFVPCRQQRLEVLQENLFVLILGVRSNNHAKCRRENTSHQLSQTALLLKAADFFGYPDLAVKRQEDEEAPGERNFGRDTHPLLPHGFLCHLDNNILTLGQIDVAVLAFESGATVMTVRSTDRGRFHGDGGGVPVRRKSHRSRSSMVRFIIVISVRIGVNS